MSLRTRVIPCLLLKNGSLVKTVRYRDPSYIGDPINTVRIFNELEVDELSFLDITASRERRPPNYALLQDISNECFMPLSYGGGIDNMSAAERVFSLGFEKLVINTATFERPALLTELARHYGSQAIIAAIDVKRGLLGRYETVKLSATKRGGENPERWARELEERGAGEILLTSVDREGTWQGFDLDLTARVTRAVSIPVIAHGGAGTVAHLAEIVHRGGASAVAVGSMVVYQKKGMGVLVNFPDRHVLIRELDSTLPAQRP